MTDFSKFKKNQNTSLDRLTKEMEAVKGGFTKDERMWKPTADKEGNGAAILRFVPTAAVDGDEASNIARYFSHSFENELNGKYYIENCRSTIGLEDPVMKLNSALWEAGSYDDKSPQKEQARKQKRQKHFIANIYVIKDVNNPSAEGKNWLWDFGPSIDKFIEMASKPPIDALTGKPMHTAFDPFNFWDGADFYLRFHVENRQRTYKNSSWGTPQPIFKTDKEIEALYNNLFSVAEFVTPDKFKSYEELEKRLNFVLGKPAQSNDRQDNPKQEAKQPAERKAPIEKDTLPWDTTDSNDDFNPDDFTNLLN
jgi:hypothetical protein